MSRTYTVFFSGFFIDSADLKQKPGVYKLFVQLPSSGFEKEFYIRVNNRD